MQTGIKKNWKISTKNIITSKEKEAREELQEQRNLAKHGDFFFCEFAINNGETRKSPVFVISSSIDKNEDVVICSCTKQPAKSQFDIDVQLRYKTYIRTNKIYTVHRNELLFKISQTIGITKLREIDSSIKLALELK